MEIDADGDATQTIAELITCMALDHSKLHRDTLAKMSGDMLTVLVAACELENLRLFICAVNEVLEREVEQMSTIQDLVLESFSMEMDAFDWHKTEQKLVGQASMDVFWYCRIKDEF